MARKKTAAPVAQDPVPEKPREKKIAIFGTTPSRMEGPWQDDSGWERWTIGPGGKDVHNWERLFEVHGVWPKDFEGYLNDLSLVQPPKQIVTIPQPSNAATSWKGAIRRWHETHGLPPDTIKGDWAAVVRYPREAVLSHFKRRMWFSSSISWCIALAITEGATEIGLWGIDLESGEEYISQHVGCAHLLDVAEMMGIKVTLPENCGLMRDIAPYPDRYETHLALTFEKKAKFIEATLGQMMPQFEHMRTEAQRIEGRILTLRELEAAGALSEDARKAYPDKMREAETALMQMTQRMAEASTQINQLKGELGATQFYRRMYVHGYTDPEEFPRW